jgi:hypothetical protein
MRHPHNRGERKAAADKARRKIAEEAIYDSGHKEREPGPDFNPEHRDRKAMKRQERAWQMVAKLLPPDAKELSPNDLFFGGKAAGGEDYLRF